MSKTSFLDLSSGKQIVNQWLCIAFISVFCFWTLLYYFVEKAQVIGESYAASVYDY